MDRGVLASRPARSRRRASPRALHDRAGRDERLLVGEREPLAGFERGERDRQPGEADHPVDHDVGVVGAPRARRPGDDLGARAAVASSSAACAASAIATTFGRNSCGLLDQQIDRRRAPSATTSYAVGLGAHDVERLGPDRSGRAEDGDARGHRPGYAAADSGESHASSSRTEQPTVRRC